jgi:glycosyltransferase involved in cell wall biosynthesis
VLLEGDLFLLPSETESFGLAALEAMAAGMPVVSSNSGGLPEVNTHGFSGYMSDVGNVEEMTKHALAILKDASTLSTFKSNAKKQAIQFSLPEILPLYLSLYKRLVESLE